MVPLVVGAASWIFSAMRRLFKLDAVTHMASVELWVLMSTLLLVVRFLFDFLGPWYAHRSTVAIVQIIQMLNDPMVQYTMGLMQLSGTRVNDYFQVWAVLLVTLQHSVKVGNPYRRSKQTPLKDLMSTFWAANLLRMQTFILLRVPLWLIWALNAFRVISYFSLSDRAAKINQENTRLVTDYMRYEHTLSQCAGKEFTMQWYKYLVLGEDQVLHELQRVKRTASSQYRIQLKSDHEKLITVERIWSLGAGSSGLLGGTADPGNRLKDTCLSFALYKLLRRRFYDLPIHEAGQAKTRQLVFDYILQESNNYERAFRVTEVELSFLQDLFHSKHATMFADGFPIRSMLLSVLLVAATGYIAYPVYRIPEGVGQDDRNRITHGVFVTHLIITLIIAKELSEIFLYVFSQWAKVRVICMYVKHQYLRRPLVEAAMRKMFWFIIRGKWNQRIFQYNLLISCPCVKPVWLRFALHRILRDKRPRSIMLEPEVKKSIFDSFKRLQEHPERLESYFSNVYGSKQVLMQQLTWAIELEADTHRILVWHIATCLCEVNLSDEATALKVVWLRNRLLVNKSRAEDAWPHYLTAMSLSNYCAYLLTNALVPDNGIVVNKVFNEVKWETSQATLSARFQSMQDVYTKFMRTIKKPEEVAHGEQDKVPKDMAPFNDQVPDRGGATNEEDPNGVDGISSSRTNERVPDRGGASNEEDPNGINGMSSSTTDEEMPDRGGATDEENPNGVNGMSSPRTDEKEPKGDDEIRNSIVQMGAKLGKQLIEAYGTDRVGLWKDLAEFWTGFLLHMAASTRAAKHKTQLAGKGELITHLWALLSHAGFLGRTRHGQTLLDPEDLDDVDPLS